MQKTKKERCILLNYAIFRSKPIMTTRDLSQIGSHNQREKQAYNSNPDIRVEDSYKNLELVPLNYKYVKRFKEITKEYEKQHNEKQKTERKERQRSYTQMLNQSRNCVSDELLFTATDKFFENMSKEDIKAWGYTCMEFVYNDLGYTKEQVLHSTIHLDEKTPHIHCVVVPLVEKFDKRTNTERYTISKKQYIRDKIHLSELQDKYHKRLTDKGYDLERGIKGSDSKHIKIKEYKRITRNINQELNTKHEKLASAISKFEDGIKNSKIVLFDKEYVKIKKDTFDDMNNIIKETKKIMEVQPKLQKVFDEVDNYSNSYKSLEKENFKYEKQIKSLKTQNYNLREENKSLKNIIQMIFDRLKEFLREILRFGNEPAKDSATYEVKYNYGMQNFSQEDIYEISRGTSKEDELFKYADIPSYYKEYNKTYEIDDDKYNMMITISKHIYENKDNKNEYEKLLDNLEKKKIFNRYERNLCLKPIFNYSKKEVEYALRRLNRQADKEAEEFYNMGKNHNDYDMNL